MSDDTTQTTDVTDVNGETSDTDNKELAYVPSFRLREQTEAKEKAEAKLAEYETKFAETDAQIQQVKLETEKTYAQEMFGNYVDDPAVQEYKDKYPDLSYKQIFGALGMEVPTNHVWHTGTPARSAGAMSNNTDQTTISKEDLVSLQQTNPTEYKAMIQKVVSREVQIT